MLSQVEAKKKQMAILITPIISGTLSVLGSSCIVYRITHRERGHWTMFHRLMLSMSLIDVFVSFNFALSTLPVNITDLPVNIWGAHGNQATCSISAFVYNFIDSVIIYNVFILIYFTLYLTTKQLLIRIKWIEVFFHLFALLYPLSTGLYSIVHGYFNPIPTLNFCYLAAYPPSCHLPIDVECTRGPPPEWLHRAMFLLPQYIAFGLFVLCFIILSSKIYITERNFTNDTAVTATGVVVVNNYIREVTIQSLLYAFTFMNTFLWTSIPYAVIISKQNHDAPKFMDMMFPYALLGRIFLPLQGFTNLIIYCGPRYRRIRKLKPDKSFIWVCKESVFGPATVHDAENMSHSSIYCSRKTSNESRIADEQGVTGQEQIKELPELKPKIETELMRGETASVKFDQQDDDDKDKRNELDE